MKHVHTSTVWVTSCVIDQVLGVMSLCQCSTHTSLQVRNAFIHMTLIDLFQGRNARVA